MTKSLEEFPVYLEVGAKRVFAGALDWPGWCVNGPDATAAIQALYEAGPRYAHILSGTRLGFKAPKASEALTVVERLKGNATTDFGAPDIPPQADAEPVDTAELRRFEKILQACWAALEAAAIAAAGRELSKGPRGGGRELEGILQHVLEAQAGYLSALGWKFKRDEHANTESAVAQLHTAVLEGLAASARGEIPARGPRGGVRWSPRYFVRRSAWHVVDHVWEIEKRLRQDD
jgi:hypothetical protein